ncbi:putative septum site-determining protein MinC [Ferrigenium kumadai]|uniref:Probable septum site-determining protein MinC n=1 Tax=Ferrigenium kumadai TaxID=1682490 RepID=A0AAN1T014_9PROT|nr:septum site-determining protein MinC [Ferrigenium kumadai]BBI99330.1 putative septum site-determining protein MinC [Ferrigenium kumadai]
MTRAEPAFKIKNANFPLFVLHVHTTDMDRFKSELEARLTQAPGFFTETPVVLGLTPIADSGVTPDIAGLVAFMGAHGMRAAGVLGGSQEQRDTAVKAGLGLFPDAPARRAPQQTEAVPEAPAEAPLPAPTKQPELPGLEAAPEEDEPAQAPAASQAEAPQPESLPAAPALKPTMVIDKPVRTGQRIYAKDANLVVLAIVNAGAELIADGDIHIYAPLRGRALAGAHGNQDARIFVHKLEAELISIAGCFQVFENGVPENVRGKPAQVRLDGSRLILEPLAV